VAASEGRATAASRLGAPAIAAERASDCSMAARLMLLCLAQLELNSTDRKTK
jgi:hypothetical protein